MKKKFVLAIALVLFLLGGFVFAEGLDPGKYTGTFQFQEIYIENVNDALKELNYPVSYETGSEDFEKYPMQLTVLEDGSLSLFFGEEEYMKSRSVTYEGSGMKATFHDSYLGYSDELAVVYTLEATAGESEVSGSFTGTILQTGKVEARGTFEVSKGLNLDLVTDFFKSGDSGEEADVAEVEEAVVGVTDILFDVTEKELTLGDRETLKATLFPREAGNKAVTFTTSDPGVVLVSQAGVVRAVGPGEALVRVFSRDNPDELDAMTIRVREDTSEISEEDLHRREEGMTLFEEPGEPADDGVVDTAFNPEDLGEAARKREEAVTQILAERAQADPTLEMAEEGTVKSLLVAGEKKTLESPDTDSGNFMDRLKSTYRLVREPAKKAVGKVMEKTGLEDFTGFVEEALDDNLRGLEDRRPKTDDEVREQLYKTFSSDKTHPALKYIQDKASSNILVKPFAYVINKLTGSKVAHYKEAVFTEYQSVKDRIRGQIESGKPREEAIKNARYDFIYNDNQEAAFEAVENAKPGFSRFFAMRQGGRQNQVATGSKTEYVDNQARFDKYLELMVLNQDLEGVE